MNLGRMQIADDEFLFFLSKLLKALEWLSMDNR